MGAQRADVAIRRLFESGFAKAPSEAAVPAPQDGMLTRSGCGGRRQLVAWRAFLFKGRREDEGYLNKEENRKGSRRRNEANAKRSGAVAVQS